MHLVHVLTSLEYGGVESFALRLLHRLDPRQFQSSIIMTTPEQGKRFDDFVAQVQLPVHQCHYEYRRRARFIWSLSRKLRELKADVVMSYAFGNHAMVAMASWLAGIPRNYVRVAGDPNRHYTKSWRLTNLARPFCTGEIAVSQSTARMLREKMGLPAERIHTIENGCEVEEIEAKVAAVRVKRTTREGESPAEPQTSPRHNGHALQLLMISRMDDAKDHETLLGALAELRQSGMKVELTLAGDGPSRTSHEVLAKSLGITDAVRFLGNCKNIAEQLGQADILVHSTRTEGMPNVLLEAMAGRVPIIASDIPPCREVLDNGKCGLLFPKENMPGLITAIQQLHNNIELQQQLVQAAAERVRSHYHVNRMVKQYEQLFVDAK